MFVQGVVAAATAVRTAFATTTRTAFAAIASAFEPLGGALAHVA